MQQFSTVSAVREWVRGERQQGKRVAMVPTMGALHAGHMALVEAAKNHAHSVLVSIFVNPTQFGPNEDYAAYPRKLADDSALCERHDVAAVYAPTVQEMYPAGYATTVSVKGITEGLCGAARPGHFDGVATVVAKLLLQAMPDIACFGEKDYQQLCVIKRLVEDLCIPVEVKGIPTAREADGLALSSRNAYLAAPERAVAPALYATLGWAWKECQHKPVKVNDIMLEAQQRLLEAGFLSVDYVSLVHAETLELLDRFMSPARLLAAARLGKARLIDNIG